MIDYIVRKYEGQCDRKHLALMGISMEGYLAARAAAFEDRIAAFILDEGVFGFYENYLQKAGELKTVIEDGKAEVANAAFQTSMYFDTIARWAFSHGMWTFGAKTPIGVFAKEQAICLYVCSCRHVFNECEFILSPSL